MPNSKTDPLSELRDTLPIRAYEPISYPRRRRRPFWWRPRRARGLPIVLTGGIGDNVIARGLVMRIKELVGDVTLYSDHPSVVEDLYRMPCSDAGEFPEYDYSLWLNSVPRFHFSDNFRGFSDDRVGELYLGYKAKESDRKWTAYIHRHPYLDNAMAREAVASGFNRETLPYHLLGMPYQGPVFDDYRRSGRGNYITVHDGFETAQASIGRATKTWKIGFWNYFVQLFREKYPNVGVWQIGGPTSRPIVGVNQSFVKKKTLKESFNILRGSMLHVDGDSGLVHAARSFRVKSVVLFGPTNAEFFGYPENVNVASRACGDCWWLKRDWLANCALGYETPRCMDKIWPQDVMIAVEGMMRRGRA